MHSVRKYPIWPRSHRTPKQNVPPHIVFWGGGLHFPHPSIFHMQFVSKPKNFSFLRRKFHFNLNNRFLKARLSSHNFFTLTPWPNLPCRKFSGRTRRSTFKISESWPGGLAQKIFDMSFLSNVSKAYDSSSLDKSRVLGKLDHQLRFWEDENFLGGSLQVNLPKFGLFDLRVPPRKFPRLVILGQCWQSVWLLKTWQKECVGLGQGWTMNLSWWKFLGGGSGSDFQNFGICPGRLCPEKSGTLQISQNIKVVKLNKLHNW